MCHHVKQDQTDNGSKIQRETCQLCVYYFVPDVTMMEIEFLPICEFLEIKKSGKSDVIIRRQVIKIHPPSVSERKEILLVNHPFATSGIQLAQI